MIEPHLRQVVGGLLVQDRDFDLEERGEMQVVTERRPTEAEWQWAARAGRALLLLLPWATIVAGTYAAGVWILLQPMQMRGMIMNP